MLVGADRPRQNAAFALEELRVIVAEKQARAAQSRKNVRIIIGSLLLAGFWDKRLGVPGALGSTSTFIATTQAR